MLNCQDSGRWSIEKNNIWFIGRPHHSDTMKICYIVRQQYCSCSIGHASVEEWNLSNADENYPQIIGRLGKLVSVQFISSQYFMLLFKVRTFHSTGCFSRSWPEKKPDTTQKSKLIYLGVLVKYFLPDYGPCQKCNDKNIKILMFIHASIELMLLWYWGLNTRVRVGSESQNFIIFLSWTSYDVLWQN